LCNADGTAFFQLQHVAVNTYLKQTRTLAVSARSLVASGSGTDKAHLSAGSESSDDEDDLVQGGDLSADRSLRSVGGGKSSAGRGKRGAQALQALAELRSEAVAELLEQRAAQEVMQDPMSRIMAAHGMPLGIAVNRIKAGSPGASAVSACIPLCCTVV
jgi:hypothetical protein